MDRSSVDYLDTYQRLKNLFVDLQTYKTSQELLKADEHFDISLTTYGEERIEKERVVYTVNSGGDSTNSCSVSTIDLEGSRWVEVASASGQEAKDLCFEKFDEFTFY